MHQLGNNFENVLQMLMYVCPLTHSTGMCCSPLIKACACLIHCLITIVDCTQFSGKPTMFLASSILMMYCPRLAPNKVTVLSNQLLQAKAKFYESINIHASNLKV